MGGASAPPPRGDAGWRAQVLSRGPSETIELARRLGAVLRGGEVIALRGDLGSGKTTFTKGLLAGLGFPDPSRVCSPTYVLEHVYEARLVAHHYDAYRLSSPDELLLLGFEERLGADRVCVIEWADRVEGVLPGETLWIELRGQAVASGQGDEGRCITLEGDAGIWAERLAPLLGSPSPGR